MKVHFGQIYIQPGVDFPFSTKFQRYLSKAVTRLVLPSPAFVEQYGRDFDLVIRVSAKSSIRDNEVRGPTVFAKDKQVEYSVFLPFDVITKTRDVPRSALQFLFKGTCLVLESLQIDTANLIERQELIIEKICIDAKMFETE